MPAETTVSGAHPAAKLPIYILPCFLWIGIVPFTFALKLKPSPDFYHDAAAAAGLIVLLFLTAGKKLFDVKIPAISFLLFAMAAFWYLQARLMNLIYPGMNDIVSWIFILLAVSAWACKSLVAHFGQERIVTLFAWSLLIGSLLQSCIVVIQFAGWEDTPLLQNLIVYSGQGVIGHIGQRNNLGHYLMWGILAAAYLNGQRKIPPALGAICLIMQTAVLGLVNSRTILTYIAAIALILPFWYFRSDKSNRRTMLGIAAAVLLTALFQFSMNTFWKPLPASATKLPSNASPTAVSQTCRAKSNGIKPLPPSSPPRYSGTAGTVLPNKPSSSMPNSTTYTTTSSATCSPIPTTSSSNSLQRWESAARF